MPDYTILFGNNIAQITLGVLIGFVLFNSLRDFINLLPNKRKAHIKKRLFGAQAALWDLELQRFELKEIREGFRVEHDKVNEQLEMRKTFKGLIEKYGLELAIKIRDYSPDLADRALSKFGKDESEEVAKTLGLTKLEPKIDDKSKEAVKNLEEQMKPLDEDVQYLRSQMDSLDRELNAVKHKDNFNGVEENIRIIVEKIKTIKSYQRKL